MFKNLPNRLKASFIKTNYLFQVPSVWGFSEVITEVNTELRNECSQLRRLQQKLISTWPQFEIFKVLPSFRIHEERFEVQIQVGDEGTHKVIDRRSLLKHACKQGKRQPTHPSQIREGTETHIPVSGIGEHLAFWNKLGSITWLWEHDKTSWAVCGHLGCQYLFTI